MKLVFYTIFICFICFTTNAQTPGPLSIEESYALASRNYPLVKQRELILKSKEYSIENASKGYLPQLNINGQASYQSAVTKIPIQIPGMNIPVLNKDQYKIYGEANQVLFDGGVIKQQKKSIEANAVVEEQKLAVELYKLKERINQLFFGILLINEQLNQNKLLKSDIQLGIDKATAQIANGTAFKSSLSILKAELLKTNQHTIELKSTRKGYIDMLSLFINRPLDENMVLLKPASPVVATEIIRPELQLYNDQRKSFDVQEQILTARNLPKFNLFFQGGAGRPGLNMLSNAFEPFAIGGVRMSWSLSGLYTHKKEKALIEISRKNIDVQKETFLFNTSFTIKQQNAEIGKLQQLLASDDEIIALRESIKTTSSAQLENGVINTSDYLREVNAEDQARQSKILHQVQLLLAQYNQQTTTGN